VVEVAAGDARYVIRTSHDGLQWTAHAERAGSGDPYGPPQTAPTEAEAVARMGRWLRWQASHNDALTELRRAEHAYHRVVAGQAFARPADETHSAPSHRDLLHAIESARKRLDAVRNQRPV
jgi:hypothetical protein